MVDQIIRPADLPNRASPNASEKIPVDNGSNVGGATVESIVLAGRPTASQAEAEAGTDAVKAMTPLTTRQGLISQIGVTIASKAQGDLASTAVQPGDLATVATTGDYDDLINKPIIPPGLVDGDKGDISVSSGGSVWEINKEFDTVADLIADVSLGYAGSGSAVSVVPGQIITAQGFPYEVKALGATGTGLVETAGGVRLYVGEGDVNVVQFGAVGDGITDDAPAINAFFQHLSYVACRSGRFEGNFATGSQIVMGRDTTGTAVDSLTKTLFLNATITTTYTDVEGTAVHNNGWRFENFNGFLRIICGGAELSSRRQRHGLIIQGSGRGKIDTIWVDGAIREGVVLFGQSSASQGNNNLFHARLIRALSCGHNQEEVITSFSNTGSANSSAQRTVITPSAIPVHAEEFDFIKHGTYQYVITNIDRVAGTVSVFPWLVSASNGNQIVFEVGAGVRMQGGDCSINKIDFIDVSNAPVGMKLRALYGPVIDTFHFNRSSPAGGQHGFGLAMSPATNSIASVFEGGVIQNLYCEGGLDYEVVSTVVTSETSFVIGSNTASGAGPNGFLQLGANAGDGKWGAELFKSVVLNQDGRTLTRGSSRPKNTTASTVMCSIAPTAIAHYSARGNSPTFQLQFDEALNRNFGYDTVICMAWGTGADGQPTGTVTFNASGGATVMGGASKTYTSLTKAMMWQCHYDYATNNWIVVQVTG